MKTAYLLLLGLALTLTSPAAEVPAAGPDKAAPAGAVARLPVKEVTVFKDGHAFVLHEGKQPVGAGGDVVMDYLPAPVIGTFWPFSADRRAKLSAVRSMRTRR